MQYSTEQVIRDLTTPLLDSLGFCLVRVRIVQGKVKVLEFMIERLDGNFASIEDCKMVSQNISALLDVEELFTSPYTLEVSSAGVERPLITLKDYERFLGRVALVKLNRVYFDTKKIQGKIAAVIDDIVTIERAQKKGDIKVEISFDDIKEANLVLTKELYKEITSGK